MTFLIPLLMQSCRPAHQSQQMQHQAKLRPNPSPNSATNKQNKPRCLRPVLRVQEARSIQPVWLQLTVALKFFISIIYYFRNFVTQMFQYGYYIIPQYFGKRVKMPLYPSSRNLELQIIMRIMSKKGVLNVCKEPLYWYDRSSDLESSTSPSQAFRK